MTKAQARQKILILAAQNISFKWSRTSTGIYSVAYDLRQEFRILRSIGA